MTMTHKIFTRNNYKGLLTAAIAEIVAKKSDHKVEIYSNNYANLHKEIVKATDSANILEDKTEVYLFDLELDADIKKYLELKEQGALALRENKHNSPNFSVEKWEFEDFAEELDEIFEISLDRETEKNIDIIVDKIGAYYGMYFKNSNKEFVKTLVMAATELPTEDFMEFTENAIKETELKEKEIDEIVEKLVEETEVDKISMDVCLVGDREYNFGHVNKEFTTEEYKYMNVIIRHFLDKYTELDFISFPTLNNLLIFATDKENVNAAELAKRFGNLYKAGGSKRYSEHIR